MSANASLSRGRSLRIPASNSVKTPPLTPTPIPASIGPSNIALFLTNIRLLDLDLRDDWPSITGVTFSTKDAQQNQKKRIQCVEWILYQLFSIWDPNEARDKLKPFFPPLEHLQSLNLRAALFRCLDHVKKAGYLGRDATLRKTMLDECKGERLEEVLALFSSAVLKKVTQEGIDRDHLAISQRLAVESLPFTEERPRLSALILAHRASLSKVLGVRKDASARYNDFADLLNLKERQTIRRNEHLKVLTEEKPVNRISNHVVQGLRETVETNWAGSSDWLETILHGDNKSQKGGLLSTGFDDIWKHVADGTIGDVEYEERKGLLEQLDHRIRQQAYRLSQWQSFERTLAKDGHKPQEEREKLKAETIMAGIELDFSAHEELQLIRSPLKATSSLKRASLGEYSEMIKNLENELESVGKSRVRRSRSRQSEQVFENEKIETTILPNDIPNGSTSPHSLHQSDSNSDTDGTSHRSENDVKSMSQTPPSENIVDVEGKSSPTHLLSNAADEVNEHFNGPIGMSLGSRHASSHSDMPPPSPPSRTASPLASEILASVLTTSPSPTKPRHVLSLAERTRLSVSRASLAKANYQAEESDDNLPELVSNPLSQKLKRSSKSIIGHNRPYESTSTTEMNNVQEDLISRTRLSMSNFATVQKNAQIDRRRSIKAAARSKRESRSSYFPTPLESAVEDEDLVLDGLDKKKLIEGEVEVDYDVVFKSRPRIKTSPERSPQRSPAKTWGEMGGRGDIEGSSSPMSQGF